MTVLTRKIHFITNGVFSTSIAGGDIHFFKMAEGAAAAGWRINYFGGHALAEVVRNLHAPGEVMLTDTHPMPKMNSASLRGQLTLFGDFFKRYRRTLAQLDSIGPDDFVYAVSDYWFDVLPAVRAAARNKMMVLHMEAPSLGQIVQRSRPDVDPARLASLHYWASQEYSLRRFVRAPRRVDTPDKRRVFFLHPAMRARLLGLGCRPEEITCLSYGLDVRQADSVPEQTKSYDVVWIGRVHRQKGIEDLLDALVYLAKRFENFRAIFIGNLREALRPRVEALGLGKHVEFSGFVSEEEKIRLFKASRLFLMPSRHEGSPRVIGESIVCGVPVLAYDIPNYRPLFGDLVRYVPPFDLAAFERAAERELTTLRQGENYLARMNLDEFKRENSWETTQAKFLAALRS
jgi:glycosyltransferase involved in cell wall biosynthesis